MTRIHFVFYENFYIEDENNKYKLHCGTFVDGESSVKDDWVIGCTKRLNSFRPEKEI